MVVIALAWIPVIKNAQGLYGYLQAVQGYLAPPIFVVFFLGVFFKRMNAQGALWAMIVGFALGLFRMFVDTPVTLGAQRIRERIPAGVVSLDRQQHLLPVLQRADHDCVGDRDGGGQLRDRGAGLPRIQSLTFETATDADRSKTRASWSRNEVAASGLVLVCILGAYLYFRG